MTVSIADYRALAELRYHLRRFLVFSETAARDAGLEPRQHQLLLALKGLPEGARPTIGVLAERLQLRHHSVVELVDRLSERGWVARKRDPSDGRAIHVRVTAAGERVLERLSLAHRTEIRTIAPELVRALRRVAGDRVKAAR